jgi:hypothetical protein
MKYFQIAYHGKRKDDDIVTIPTPYKARNAIEAINKFMKDYPCWSLHSIKEIKPEAMP